MAWCRQATSHYLSQCWPRSVAGQKPSGITRPQWVTSLAPERFGSGFKIVMSEGMLQIISITDYGSWALLVKLAKKTLDDKSTWVQVMAWCCQPTSHYLSQCWLISMSLVDNELNILWLSCEEMHLILIIVSNSTYLLQTDTETYFKYLLHVALNFINNSRVFFPN